MSAGELRTALQGASLGDCRDMLQRVHAACDRKKIDRTHAGARTDDDVATDCFKRYSAMAVGSASRSYLKEYGQKVLRGSKLYEAERKETSK